MGVEILNAMNIATELLVTVMASVITGAVLSAARQAWARWNLRRAAPADDLKKEDCPMGRPGETKDIELPYGAHRHLVELLRKLRAATRPGPLSVRDIADGAQVSTGTVQNALNGTTLPSRQSVAAIAGFLAERAVRRRTPRKHERAVDKVHQQVEKLWEEADWQAKGPDPFEAAVRDLYMQMDHGAGANLPDHIPDIVWAAIQRSRLLVVNHRRDLGFVDLFIETPDEQTARDLEENEWTGEFSDTVSGMVGKDISVIVFVDIGDEQEEGTAEAAGHGGL